jgi:spore coat protein CotH
MDRTLVCFALCASAVGCVAEEGGDMPLERSNIVTSRKALTVNERNVRADEFYALDNVLTIDIYMDPDDWAELEAADPVGGLCNAEYIPPPDRFEDYEPTRVVITGTDPSRTVDISNTGTKNVEIQKKGWCGSHFAAGKPGLKIKFKKSVEDAVRDLIGVKKVMLNNAFDDPTYIRQCVGHRLLKDAGVPYSRCNFARVRVNGVDLTSGFEASTGLYVNVEPIDEIMLYNNFGNSDGNDYEFEIGEDFIHTTANIDRVEVNSVSAFDNKEDFILAAEQVEVHNLENVFDMDAFVKYFAMEFLLMNLDGYAANQNNVHVYNDVAAVEHPVVANSDVNFKFIPWGIDRTFGDPYSNDLGDYMDGLLANEVRSPLRHIDLYNAFQRQVYLYLGSLFNPKALEGEFGDWIRSVAAVAESAVPGTQVPADAADKIINFMMQRRAEVNEAFDVNLPSTDVRIEGWNDECVHRGRSSVGTDAWSMDHKPCGSAVGDSYLFRLEEATDKPGYYKLVYNQAGASFTYTGRSDSTHKVGATGLNDVYYGRGGSNTDYPQYFGLIPVGDDWFTPRQYEIQSVDTGLCWHFSGSLKTSENNFRVYQFECNNTDEKNLVDFVEPPPPPACDASTAQDLGSVGQETTVPTDGCVKVQAHYPWYWGTSRRMKFQNPSGNLYPVPFTWTNACSGGNGSSVFNANWNDKWFNNINSTCATVIDLQGPAGGLITLRYWAD